MTKRNEVNSVSMDPTSWGIAQRFAALRKVSRSLAISQILHEKAWTSKDPQLVKLAETKRKEMMPQGD